MIIDAAIGDADLSPQFPDKRRFLQSRNGGTSRLVGAEESYFGDEVTEVSIMTLQHLMKISNASSFEPQVINSGLKYISLLRPTILVEYTNSSQRKSLSDWDEEFLNFLFATYSNVCVVDQNEIRPISLPDDLLRFSPNKVLNLIFD